jgi:hypothetical protein
MAWDWTNLVGSLIGSIIGAAISFGFAVLLLSLKEKRKERKESEKKEKLYKDLFKGFSKLYENAGCVLLFRTFPLIIEDIQQKLSMITNLDYILEEIRNDDSKMINVYQTRDPTKMIIWLYDHEWYFKIHVSKHGDYIDIGYSVQLNNMVENKTFHNNEAENLIKFLEYLENKYQESNIIGKDEIILSNEIKDSIKSYYSKKE